MVQHTKCPERSEEANGVKDIPQDYVGIGEDHSMSFDFRDVVDFAVDGASIAATEKPQNGTCIPLRRISKANLVM